MDIKNTFLYFWCFKLGNDKTKYWLERNNFYKIIFVLIRILILAIYLAVGFVILNFLTIFIAIVGDYILNMNNCHMDDKYSIFIALLGCSKVGAFYALMWFLEIFLTILLFIRLIPLVVMLFARLKNYWFKTIYIVLIILTVLIVSVYGLPLLGILSAKIFFSK